MEKRHNYAAAGFLLLGIGAAGRAFLGVPEGVTMAELSLTVLLVIGALLLTRQGLAALVCGLAATALELVLCGSWVQAGGALAAAAPFLRLADLWLLLGLVWGSLPAARRAVDDLKYTRSTRMMLVACGVLLAAHTVLRIASLAAPASVPLGKASSGSFVVHRADGQSIQRSAHQTLSIRPFCALWGAGWPYFYSIILHGISLHL